MKQHEDGQITITRDELYDLVWETPMQRLSSRFHLSDVGLAKVCKKHNIPRPPPGHWAKVASGKPSRQAKLPARPDGPTLVIRFAGPSDKRFGSTPPSPDPAILVPIAKTLARPHPIVAELQSALKGETPNEQGLLCPGEGSPMDVLVSAKSACRAMRIFQAVVRVVEASGDEVTIKKGYSGREMVAVLDGEAVSFRLRELATRKDVVYTEAEVKKDPWLRSRKSYTYTPTGKLMLEVTAHAEEGTRRRWADGKIQRLEKMLPAFIASLYRIAKDLGEKRRSWEEHRRKEEEKARKLREDRRLQEIEEADFRNLIANVDAWHQSNRIRAYVAEVLEMAEKAQGPLPDDNYHKMWAVWASAHADRVDPLEAVET